MSARKKMPGIDVDRLVAAMRRDRRSMQFAREQRKDMVQQLAGSHWGEGGSKKHVPVNIVSLYCSVVLPKLIANDPRALISTHHAKGKAMMAAINSAVNLKIKKMGLGETLQRCTFDAAFFVGICKTALATPEDAAAGGWAYSAGRAFSEPIDLDDFVFDGNSRSFRQPAYLGHKSRVPYDAVMTCPYFDKAQLKNLQPAPKRMYNDEGDERIDELGRGSYGDDESEDYVELWEVYLPRFRAVVTLLDSPGDGPQTGGEKRKPLRIQPFIGNPANPCGPYRFLEFIRIPGNAMPKGPIHDIFDMHMTINGLYRKTMRQAHDAKNLTAFQKGSDEDAARVKDAPDGDMIGLDNPTAITKFQSGGVDAAIMQYGMHLWDQTNKQGGNLEAVGGMSPQAKTLGQDRMLTAAATGQIASMQEKVVSFTASVVEDLAWYEHHDPIKSTKSHYVPQGLPEYAVEEEYSPQDRSQVPFDELDIRVDPYSLQHKSPQDRAQALMGVVQAMAPYMALLQQNNVQFDPNYFLTRLGELMDEPDLAQIYVTRQSMNSEAAAPSGDTDVGMPAQTSRIYERISTASGQDQQRSDLMNSMSTETGASTQ